MTRQTLRSLPEGTYRHVDYLDNDGIELDKLVRIEVAVTIADGAMMCDFTGTSPQVRGPFNCMASGPLCGRVLCAALGNRPEGRIPDDGGCSGRSRSICRRAAWSTRREPAPTGCRTSTIKRITNVYTGCASAGGAGSGAGGLRQRDRYHAFRRAAFGWSALCDIAASGRR